MKWLIAILLFTVSSFACADELTVKMYQTVATGQGELIGQVIFKDTKFGLLITPNLHNLTPGLHGFHIHAMADCADMGNAAGGHLDPKNTGKHLGPYSTEGHLGDLPALNVNNEGIANVPTLAPRLTTKEIVGHTLMIHKGGDNYSDQPTKLGGGGERVACGVISGEKQTIKN